MNVLVAKVGFVGLASIGCLLFGRSKNLFEHLTVAQADRLLVLTFVLCRIVPFVVIYVMLGAVPRSDVPHFYDAATHALGGDIVYRDFWSPYSPLFSYLTSLPLLLWHDMRMLTLLMIGMEGLAWWLTYRQYSRQLWAGVNPAFAAWIYLLLPAPFIFSVLGGQEDSWMWFFAISSLYLWQRRPDAFYLGAWWAVALLSTKALTVFAIFGLLIWTARPWRFLLGLTAVGLPALAVMVWLTGEGVLTPLAMGTMRFAPNGWTVLAPLIGEFVNKAGVVSAIGLVLLLAVSGLSGWQLRQAEATYQQTLPLLWLFIYGGLMLLHKNSFGNYMFIYALPLLFTLVDWKSRPDRFMLLLLSATSAIHPTLWWALNQPIYTDWRQLQAPLNWVEYGLGVVMLISVGYFIRKAYRQTVRRPMPQRHVVLT